MVCDMKEIQIRKNDAGQRLDRFVGKAVPLLPESLLQKYIRLKRIKRNGKGWLWKASFYRTARTTLNGRNRTASCVLAKSIPA